MTHGVASVLGRRELLTSGTDTNGLVHAFYASATRTLCNRRRPERAQGQSPRPSCAVCVETARAFDRIDGSCPEHWRRKDSDGSAAVTRTGYRGAQLEILEMLVGGPMTLKEVSARRRTTGAAAYQTLKALMGKGQVVSPGRGVYALAAVSEREEATDAAPDGAAVVAEPVVAAPVAEPAAPTAAPPRSETALLRVLIDRQRRFLDELEALLEAA